MDIIVGAFSRWSFPSGYHYDSQATISTGYHSWRRGEEEAWEEATYAAALSECDPLISYPLRSRGRYADEKHVSICAIAMHISEMPRSQHHARQIARNKPGE